MKTEIIKYKNIIDEAGFVELLKKSVNKVIRTSPDSSSLVTLKVIPPKGKYLNLGDINSIYLYNDFFCITIIEGRLFSLPTYAILYENISNVELIEEEVDELTNTKISTLTLKKKTEKKNHMKYYVKIQYKNQLSEFFGVQNIGVAKTFYDTIKNKIAQENKDDIVFIRLNKLKKLYDESLISEEEYKKRKEEILKEI